MVASTLENHSLKKFVWGKYTESNRSRPSHHPRHPHLTSALPCIYSWVWLCFLHASCIYRLTLEDCPALENKIHAYLLWVLLQTASYLASIWNLFLCRLSDGTSTPQSFRANYFGNTYSCFYTDIHVELWNFHVWIPSYAQDCLDSPLCPTGLFAEAGAMLF